MLELDGVRKSFAGFDLGPVSLSVDDEVLAVLGPSGCGKTTLLSTVAGIVAPDAGTVTLDGRRLDGLPPEDRSAVLTFQDGALFPHMTARENVAYAASDPGAVEDLAETLAVADVLDQRADTLSGGERQRVAVARALAAEPAALLFDEPLANLDAPIRRRLRRDLRSVFEPMDVPVVYVTHDQREATAVGDRVAVLRDGAVEQVGTTDAVFSRPANAFVASFTGNPNVFRGAVTAGVGSAVELRWGDRTLSASGSAAHRDASSAGPSATDPAKGDGDAAVGVTFCIRPEDVRLTTTDDGDDTTRGACATNRIPVRVVDVLFEGDRYTVRVDPVGVDAALTVTALPPTVDERDVRVGDELVAVVPPERIHVVDDERRD